MAERAFLGHPDHDACGTGFIVQLARPAGHEVVSRALLALRKLSHRGGSDADGSSGDGVGLMTALPLKFIRKRAHEMGLDLPPLFGLGMLFLSREKQQAVRRSLEQLAAERGLRLLGWREVPTERSVLGWRAAESVPAIWQCFLAAAHGESDLETELFLFRKHAEATLLSDVYFCSLSSRTVVYKGLLTPKQLPHFYPDLASDDFESQFAIFHQRFSTNTQPSWTLAQPFRFLAHNGEINTIVGNRRWMLAREPELRRQFHAGSEFHALENNVSDSATLDNALELLVRQSMSPAAAMIALVPPAYESDWRFGSDARSFLESMAREYEPWDGPAALVFSDGRTVGAKLDRNGLRPLRYTRTSDGWLVAASEAGVLDVDPRAVVERRRLGPGEMLMVDLASGQVHRNGEFLRLIARRQASRPCHQPARLPSLASASELRVDEPKKIAGALGWTEDQLRLLLYPLAEGKEAVWSMGDDTPPAFMSQMRRTLWDYCKQRFAQVTNPPIDPLREAHVMSLNTLIGQDFILDSPLLQPAQLKLLEAADALAPVRRIDITFTSAAGPAAALELLQQLEDESFLIREGRPRLVVLSDLGVSQQRAALPVLLATSAVWQTMVKAGMARIPLIVESGQIIETHAVALLLSSGATAVCPFLALQLAQECNPGGATNYQNALAAGLRKVLSRMGISTVASYRNGQLFETVGLGHDVVERFFPDAAHVAEATSLEALLEDYLENHRQAFCPGHAGLKDAGLYRYRKEGERHSASPDMMRKLHAHIKDSTAETRRQYEELSHKREPVAVRDRLEFVPQTPVDISEVESESEIFKRFSSQAMSLGAISPEAHRTLALGMNALGARSNTGEGGEDPQLYRTEPHAANKIKQVASARFGVTAEYLVNAAEIEIKMAQGSKPGEGGQLPATKVSAYIARLRHAVPGMALISPPPHHDIYSIEDLEQLIHDLREVNPHARIGVKLVSGAGVGIIAAGVAKAGADVITISGHDGGTGASPLSSIKNTGLPWEFGLRDAHRTLLRAGSRHRVRLRVDGGLKFARDVVIAALLGADEFGFGTAALLAIGCVMARQCHLNTCPVGIATQDESLRTRFAGKPEMVMAFFRAIATEVRALLSSLGAHSLSEIVGRAELLRAIDEQSSPWIDGLLEPEHGFDPVKPISPMKTHRTLARDLGHLITVPGMPRKVLPITNEDRSVGAFLSGEAVRRFGTSAHKPHEYAFAFAGVSGQSFGAFLSSGISFRLYGEANDYVGKGLSGGSIAITAGARACLRGDVLAGNAVLYGATSGELYLAGSAGERFAVRNSGAVAVVEGAGDHACEYMTGGVVLILGPTGINLGSGMTGGLTYILRQHFSPAACNSNFVRPASCSAQENASLIQVLRKHVQLTGSPRAAQLLSSRLHLDFVRLEPLELPCAIEKTWEAALAVVNAPRAADHEVLDSQLPVPLPDAAAFFSGFAGDD